MPTPTIGAGEVLIDVAATAVNRADILQRQGQYPPPPGASDILGLECAGTVAAIDDRVTAWNVGDRVCALLSAGGYATQVAVPAGQLLPVPDAMTFEEAAALPEVVSTVWSNVFMIASLQPSELLLVHGGAGGIGTCAIQLAHALGARVATTVGSHDKAEVCRALGADLAINYKEADFVAEVRALDKSGANVILDVMGASYLAKNVDALAREGRLVVIGMQGGARGELDLGALMSKRGAVIATTLRARPADEKAAIVASVREHAWPLVVDGTVKPVIHKVFPLDQVSDAHVEADTGRHVGKIVITA